MKLATLPTIQTHERIEDDPKRGFRHAGEFFLAVRHEGKNFSNPKDERLKRMAVAPTTFGNEVSGADGGFLIPPEFAQEVADLANTDESLLPFCDVMPIEGNSMVFPRDETTPWGSTGARAYWQNEASAGTQSKPALRADPMRLDKLFALVPVTDELSEDASTLGVYLTRQMGKSIRWKANEALLFGNGEGIPLGAFNSNAQITVAKESGQATQTLQIANLAKMIARLPPGSFGSALWLLNSDVLPAFFSMTAVSGIFWVGGKDLVPSAKQAVLGLIIGRPAIVSTHAKAFSSQGDVILVDMSYMRVIEKAAGIQIATSLHIYFDADALAFRAIFRLDAQPKLTAPINPSNGTTTLSPFIQLGAR